jgi:ribonuclease-3
MSETKEHLSIKDITSLEKILMYHFKSTDILSEALIHSSAREQYNACNERLEFLGDSVLGLVVAEYFYEAFPDSPEGALSNLKSLAVSTETLAGCVKKLDISKFIKVGLSMSNKAKYPSSVLAGVLEAIVASIYLDGGLESAKKSIIILLKNWLYEVSDGGFVKNYKSLLQQHVQASSNKVPNYIVLSESGPDHKKIFKVCAEIDGVKYRSATGHSKKEAEQKAAKIALTKLGLLR